VAEGVAESEAESANKHKTEEDQENSGGAEGDFAIVLAMGDFVLVFFECGSHGGATWGKCALSMLAGEWGFALWLV
jgi:hypothetical protein